MTLKELAKLGKAMRDAQKAFFADRCAQRLNEARKMERIFDEAVLDCLDDTPSLFAQEE